MRRWLSAIALAAVGAVALPSASANTASPVPAFIAPDAHWLTTVNYYRAMAGLAPVTENTSWSAGAANHSCYMLYNGMSHDEIPGYPAYTSSGDLAGNSGNVAVSSQFGTTARSHIDLWMTGPFHAIGVLRHNLRQVGFGTCDISSTSPWKSGATLDVIRGLVTATRPTTPILFPGHGTTTGLDTFVAETPNPLDFCGWTGSAGLPVIAMMPEAVSSATASMTGPSGPVETCRLFAGNTSGEARSLLAGENAVVVVPRSQLTPGVYSVSVSTQARTVNWSFTVDNTADTGLLPVPIASPTGAASGMENITPFRFADSRPGSQLRLTSLSGGVPKRIKISGVAGLPTGLTAINANLTVVTPSGAGYLTAYNCSTQAPTAAFLNYQAMETIGNAGILPLSATGDLCVVSSKSTHLVMDVSGYARPAEDGRLKSTTPTQIVNTETGLGLEQRLHGNTVVEFNAFTAGATPGATAVNVNLTSTDTASNGYITMYPCGASRPQVATLNPLHGLARSNQAIVPVAADGRLCVYSSTDTELRVELLGSVLATGSAFTPSTPTRLTDTRDPYRPEMNAGTGGSPVAAGQTVTVAYGGQRGIPANATAVSVNIAITGAAADGTLTVWPCGPRPSVTSMAFRESGTIANGVQAKLSSTGQLCIHSTSTAHVIVDIAGWWS